MDKDVTQIDGDQLARDARGAFQFISSEYGERLISRFLELHMGLHEQAERDDLTIEQKGVYATKAAGVKQCLDMILKEAQLVSSGELERMEKQERLAAQEAQVI